MKGFILGIILGLLVGGVLTFFIFVGVPHKNVAPGEPIKPPDAGTQASAAEIVLPQEFFNTVLAAVFSEANKPAFELSSAAGSEEITPQYAFFQQPCDGKITILPEGSGARTGVTFENNRITSQIAFEGSYRSPIGCFPLKGWARGALELRYDASQQAVFGVINVETVNLEGVDYFVNAVATPLVQSTLNTRVNPIRILDARQLAVNVPVASTGGTLQANVNDVRAEVKDNALNLYITYQFKGGA